MGRDIYIYVASSFGKGRHPDPPTKCYTVPSDIEFVKFLCGCMVKYKRGHIQGIIIIITTSNNSNITRMFFDLIKRKKPKTKINFDYVAVPPSDDVGGLYTTPLLI